MASVGIIGSGMAGLVTAKTLLDDGFKVQILTRERAPGGVWSNDRVYPGLRLNKCVFTTLFAFPFATVESNVALLTNVMKCVGRIQILLFAHAETKELPTNRWKADG